MSRSRARRAGVPCLALVLAVAGGCPAPTEDDGATRVRVVNASPRELRAVTVVFPRDERLAAAVLASGAATPYRRVRDAYRYAYVEAVVDGERLVLQPIDYVGERPLGPGCFTYDLTLDAPGPRLGILAREEPACP